jgi:hypothetical protein
LNPFYFLFSSIALVRNSKTILNRGGENRQPVSFLTLMGMVSVFLHLI